MDNSLFWKGVWEITSNKVPYDITDQSGVYMILTGHKEALLKRWKLLDQIIAIEYSKNIRKGLRDSMYWDEWEKHKSKSLVVKYAAVDSPEVGENIVKCLKYNHHPLVNDEKEPEGEHTGKVIEVKNKMKRWPLPEMSTWHIRISTPPPKTDSDGSS